MRIKFNISRFAEEGDKVVSQKALRSYHEKMRNLLKQSQGDWNENNENKLNYVKNRPFYNTGGHIIEEKEYSRPEGTMYYNYGIITVDEDGTLPTGPFTYSYSDMSYSANDTLCYFMFQSDTPENRSDSENHWYMWDNLIELQLGNKTFILSPSPFSGSDIKTLPTGVEESFYSSRYLNEAKTVAMNGDYYESSLHTEIYINLTKEGLEDEIYVQTGE